MQIDRVFRDRCEIAAEMRRQYVATTAQCARTNKYGNRCNNRVKSEGELCWMHTPETARTDVIAVDATRRAAPYLPFGTRTVRVHGVSRVRLSSLGCYSVEGPTRAELDVGF